MKNHILLLEDEESLNRGICFKLEKEGYTVFAGSTLKDGFFLFEQNEIHLIVCDIGLEDGSGLDFCKEIRKKSNIRFLFLTALDQEMDIVMGYEAGADDYMTKPFSLAVLISKINAIFRGIDFVSGNEIESGDIVFYKDEMKVLCNGVEKILTKNELKLLMLFLESPKQIFSKNQLLELLWDAGGDFVDENTIAVNIRRLREKIESDPSNPVYIKNIRGIGYLWDRESRRR